MTYLYHLISGPDFTIDPEPESLQTEGFVHLSSQAQVLRTANRWFKDATELKLAVLDPEKLGSALKWEDTYGHGEEFPHLYAPLSKEAIVGIVVLGRGHGGDFEWPTILGGLQSPILEDLSPSPGMIEPSVRFPERKLPSKCVLCFFQDVLKELDSRPEWSSFEGLGSEIGATKVWVRNDEVAVCHPGVGGPLAGATLEELIALGCTDFVVCGGAGSLVPEQTLGHLVLPTSAIRDEGLSHHYLTPSREVIVNSSVVHSLSEFLAARNAVFTKGRTWTTDGLYRETKDKITRRRTEGCVTVEMELASLLAVAQYREARLGALLYCGDDVGSDSWDFRDWTSAHSVRERLFGLALEAVLLGD